MKWVIIFNAVLSVFHAGMLWHYSKQLDHNSGINWWSCNFHGFCVVMLAATLI